MEKITVKLNDNQDKYFTNINLLPLELQSKILQFCIFPYDFDKDMVNFYISNLAYVVNGKLYSSLNCWFGTENPENNEEYFLHSDLERPYPLELERQFSLIANKIYNDNKKFKFKDDITGVYKFSGTYGPLKNNVCKDYNFNKTGNAIFYYDTGNLSEYFNEMNIINNEIVLSDAIEVESNNKLNIYTAINRLGNLISVNVRNTIEQFKKVNKNIIIGPFSQNKVENISQITQADEFKTTKHTSFYNFYKICKKVPDNYVLLNLNMLRKIRNKQK
jgi:hypothetical protein